MKMSPVSRPILIAISAYIAAQMISDIASLKIGIVSGLAVDMGTFIYPITFTLRDIVHKLTDKKTVQTLIVLTGFINLLMAAYFYLITKVPGAPDWGLGSQFSAIFSPVWRIVVASILAEVISELIDTEVYQRFANRFAERYQWGRVLLSNSISIPVDNAVFALGAFAFVLPWTVIGQIFIVNFIVKYLITLLSLPMIYWVKNDNRLDHRFAD